MNYYQILGVSKNASQEELKDAYKTLVKKYHPDLYQGDKTFAEKKTKEINVAYDILSNPTTRAEYDEEITPKNTDITYEYTPPKYNNPSSYSYHDYYRNKTYSDFGDYDKRYTNYHRSKTPSSNYSTQKNIHDEFSDNIVNSIDRMTFSSKIKGLILIFTIYIFIFAMAVHNFDLFSKNKSSGTIINNNKSTYIPANTFIPEHSSSNHNNSKNATNNSFEDFNINDYFSDEELYDVYTESYSDIFSSFQEFKETMSYYVYLYYNF